MNELVHSDMVHPLIAQANFKPKILIVDDEPKNVKLLSAIIGKDNFQIIEAFNGQEAKDKIQLELPDVILLDIMMPIMDGYQVTKWLKSTAEYSHIPVIMITALDKNEYKQKALEAGAEEFINKPVNPIELMARISSMLKLKQYKDQLILRIRAEKQFTIKASQEFVDTTIRKRPRILLVEDDLKDYKLMRAYLSQQEYDLIYASSGEDAIALTYQNDVELIILDIVLPGINGFEVCRRLKELEHTKNIPIIFTTSLNDVDNKIKGVEVEGDDYCIKPIDSRELKAKISLLLKKKQYLDDLRNNYEFALNSAIKDSLTGLYNKAYFKNSLDNELKRAQRQNYYVSMIMIDIDNFKNYNDTLGHLVGDIIIRNIAQLIKKYIREIDLPARYGGEEFSVILPYANTSYATSIADRILEKIASFRHPIDSSGQLTATTVSIGLATFPTHAVTMEELMMKADEKLYLAKRTGKNKVCF